MARVEDRDGDASLTTRQAYCLFLSHSLSMWNSRMYEFAVILFIQSSFPGNLTASSINGIAETVCVFLFASALGRWVDSTPSSRLRVLLTTIIVHRVSILVSCTVWFVILSSTDHLALKRILFSGALVLGMVEKLSRGTNIIAMERDWLPTLANTTSSVDDSAGYRVSYDLTHLNTVVRRIDMLCKLVAPLAVSTFVAKVESERLAVVVLAAISTLSLGPECWGAQKVWSLNSRLRVRKERDVDEIAAGGDQNWPIKPPSPGLASSSLHGKIVRPVTDSLRAYVTDFRYYFSTSVWIPSLCATIPHASVLTFSGTMLTYLLNAGYPLSTITGARASGAVFEIASTFIFPWAVRRLSASSTHHPPGGWFGSREGYREVEQRELADRSLGDIENDDQAQSSPNIEQSVIRVGSWALGGLLLTLIPAVLSLMFLDARLKNEDTMNSPPSASPHRSPPTLTTSHPLTKLHPTILILILSISLSLLCRWTYDLCATQLTQALVPAAKRSSFGGTEMSIVSLVSLCHWVAAAVWHAQDDFKWLALGSLVLVAVGVGMYQWWRWQGWWWERRSGENGRGGEELRMDVR